MSPARSSQPIPAHRKKPGHDPLLYTDLVGGIPDEFPNDFLDGFRSDLLRVSEPERNLFPELVRQLSTLFKSPRGA
jgi:hypothetical protein